MRLRVVPARTGAQWVREGLRLFFKQPLAFAGLFFVFMAVTQVLGLVPVVGNFVGLALVPAFTVGMMTAARHVEAGRFPMPAVLLKAFRDSPAKTRAILLLGVLYAAALFAIMLVASDDGKLAALIAANQGQITEETMKDPAMQEAVRNAMGNMLLASILYLPVSILFFHSPALVHWYGVPVVRSLFFSAVAVLRNTGAFFVYFMGWTMVGMTASLVLLMVSGMLGSMAIATAGLLPISLVVASMVMASLWPTFRDCFDTGEEQPAGDLAA